MDSKKEESISERDEPGRLSLRWLHWTSKGLPGRPRSRVTGRGVVDFERLLVAGATGKVADGKLVHGVTRISLFLGPGRISRRSIAHASRGPAERQAPAHRPGARHPSPHPKDSITVSVRLHRQTPYVI